MATQAGVGPLVLYSPDGAAPVQSVQAASERSGFNCVVFRNVNELVQNEGLCWRAAVVFAPEGNTSMHNCWKTLQALRSQCRSVFTILCGSSVCGNAALRLDAFAAGARMVCDQVADVEAALTRVASLGLGGGQLACPTCGLSGLTEDELHLHHPFYHACEPNHHDQPPCVICGANTQCFPLHLHNDHGLVEEREPQQAPHAAFAWTVCRRRDGRFLMVNEPAGISGGAPRYWLPAGRVDIGESLITAAERETLEEGGVAVRVIGVLRFMVQGLKAPGRACRKPCPRIVFLAEPCDDATAVPKSLPDWESVGALWVEAEAVTALQQDDFRSPDPPHLFPQVASGQLRPHSIDTDSFRRFDQLLMRLTTGEQLPGEFAKAWNALRAEYPPELFAEH